MKTLPTSAFQEEVPNSCEQLCRVQGKVMCLSYGGRAQKGNSAQGHRPAPTAPICIFNLVRHTVQELALAALCAQVEVGTKEGTGDADPHMDPYYPPEGFTHLVNHTQPTP